MSLFILLSSSGEVSLIRLSCLFTAQISALFLHSPYLFYEIRLVPNLRGAFPLVSLSHVS